MASESHIKEALAALAADPKRAAALCNALLEQAPQSGEAQLVLSEALRLQGDLAGAGRAEERAAQLGPIHPTIWRDLGDALVRADAIERAQAAYARYAALPLAAPRLIEAARALAAGDAAAAGPMIEGHLALFPNDVVALRMLADAQTRTGRPDLAERSLRRCLELAPGFGLARHTLGQVLNGSGRFDEALAEARELLRQDPNNKGSQRLLAAIQINRGEFDETLEIYERHLRDNPAQPTIWMSLGHALKTVGRTKEAIAAYRKSIELAPTLGVSYWSLADLKTFRFSPEDRARMEAALRRSDVTPPNRVCLHYALGKAFEDADEPAGAFSHYREGAALYRRVAKYDAERTRRMVDQAIAVFTPVFFAERAGAGCPAPDPIFILGLPRSGSTLIEQVLASHSAVEGTMELPDLGAIAHDVAGPERVAAGGSYLDMVAGLDAAALTALGERYLRTTAAHRRLGRACFIDKMPNNWAYVGLIQLILPNAKIIDVRRHPMACCWSCYKQHFAMGQSFTYDLADLGRYYGDYLRLMAHWDAVLPGRVHRVTYEDLVAAPEPHIRALLGYCGLPFEDACLRPHETRRAIMSASSEQVRRPITATGMDDWRKFEPWLGDLKSALGDALRTWRGASA